MVITKEHKGIRHINNVYELNRLSTGKRINYYIRRLLSELRKGIKIKSWLLLLAWLAIFLHNTIPHNHIDEDIAGCHELIHNSMEAGNEADRTVSFSDLPSENKVCHISGFLFHSFNPDHLIFQSVKAASFVSETNRSNTIISADQFFIPVHYPGSTSFRGPPVV